MQHRAYKAWPIVLLFFGLSFQAAAVDHCKPSKWGADDEIGAANYVNPQQILAATRLVKLGESHGLGIVIEPACRLFRPGSRNCKSSSPVNSSASTHANLWLANVLQR